MVLNFVTSYVTENGPELNLKKVARRYVMSWFLPDIMVILAEWYSLYLHYTAGPGTSRTSQVRIIRLLKIARAVRTVRAGRLAQVQPMLEHLCTVMGLSLPTVKFALGLTKLVFLILWLNHLGACSWWMFVTGSSGDNESNWHNIIAAEYEVDDLHGTQYH